VHPEQDKQLWEAFSCWALEALFLLVQWREAFSGLLPGRACSGCCVPVVPDESFWAGVLFLLPGDPVGDDCSAG